jgi:hypothetical protein
MFYPEKELQHTTKIITLRSDYLVLDVPSLKLQELKTTLFSDSPLCKNLTRHLKIADFKLCGDKFLIDAAQMPDLDRLVLDQSYISLNFVFAFLKALPKLKELEIGKLSRG